MKRLMQLLAVALMFACGSAEDFDDTDAGLDDPTVDEATLQGDELGTSEQAFSVSGSFGLKSNNARCGSNSTCFVPKTSPVKTVKYSVGCAGCSTDQVQGLDLGVAAWAASMSGQGYAMTKIPAGGAGELININQDTSVSDITVALNGPTGQDHIVGTITYRPFTHCTAKVDFSEDITRINGGFYGNPATQCLPGSSCRKNIFGSHAFRALGFCSGLGTNPTVANSAMSVAPYGVGAGPTVNMADFNSSEKTQLGAYQQ